MASFCSCLICWSQSQIMVFLVTLRLFSTRGTAMMVVASRGAKAAMPNASSHIKVHAILLSCRSPLFGKFHGWWKQCTWWLLIWNILVAGWPGSRLCVWLFEHRFREEGYLITSGVLWNSSYRSKDRFRQALGEWQGVLSYPENTMSSGSLLLGSPREATAEEFWHIFSEG